MTASVGNQALAAAAPSLIAFFQAFQQFEADVGTNPATMAVNFIPAKIKFLGTVGLLLPQLETSEIGAVQGILTGITNGWVSQLQALQASVAAQDAAKS